MRRETEPEKGGCGGWAGVEERHSIPAEHLYSLQESLTIWQTVIK